MASYGKSSRIFPIILIIVIVVIAIAAFISIARAAFSGDKKQQVAVVDVSRETLLATKPENRVQMTVRGGIVADEAFHSYRVSISPNARTLTTYNGYLATPVQTIQLGNNVAAYDEFVHALDKANLAKGKAFTDPEDDTRGICATGRVYEYEIIKNDSTVKRLWSSTCKGSPGSLQASVSQLTDLFVNQIPDGRTAINKIAL